MVELSALTLVELITSPKKTVLEKKKIEHNPVNINPRLRYTKNRIYWVASHIGWRSQQIMLLGSFSQWFEEPTNHIAWYWVAFHNG